MGGGKRGVGVVDNAQHAQGASARVHGGEEWGKKRRRFSTLPPLSYSVDDEEDDEDDEEDGRMGRLLRRCWLCGMPRCTAR
jgi:hypothetical protein